MSQCKIIYLQKTQKEAQERRKFIRNASEKVEKEEKGKTSNSSYTTYYILKTRNLL